MVGAVFSSSSFISIKNVAQRHSVPSDFLKTLKGKAAIHTPKRANTRMGPGVLTFVLIIKLAFKFRFTGMPLQGISRVNIVKYYWLVSIHVCKGREII